MKTKLFAFIAAMMVSTSMMAQGTVRESGIRTDRAPRDKATMIKEYTEKMTMDYELTEEQVAQVLDLNTKYAEKLPMFNRRMRRPEGGPRLREGAPVAREDGTPIEGDRGPKIERQRPTEAQIQARRAEMETNMKEYNAELEKIMTPEQFAKYQENLKRMSERFQKRRIDSKE